MRLFGLFLTLGLAGVTSAAIHQSWPDWWWRIQKPTPEALFVHRLQPFVEQTCYECHDSRMRKGDFAIDRLSDPASLQRDREAWERVLQHVSNNLMPPAGADQPAPEDRAKFVSALDRALHPIDPKRPDPGRVVIRRLNREEYKNSVQDLFGITFDPAADLPDDDSGHGFDHLGDVLSLSPLLLERYLAAAEKIAAELIPDPMPPPRIFVAMEGQWKGSQVGPSGRASEGMLTWKVTTPAEGSYKLKLRVYEDAAGPEETRFSFAIGKTQVAGLSAKGSRKAPREHSYDVDLPAGAVELQVTFLNDFYEKETATQPAQDRNFYVESVKLEGPYLRPGQKRPQGKLPAWLSQRRPEEAQEAWLARAFTLVMRRAFRRSPTSEEVTRLVTLMIHSQKAGDSVPASLQLGLQAILVSPDFLFRGEPPASPNSGERIVRLSDHALATRLAYFLWSGPPDDHLLSLADSGKLRDQLAAETRRMLADPRAARFVDNFAGQWLEVRNLPLRTPDRKLYPDWNKELALSMKEETLRFFADFLTNDRPMLDLLTADYTFLDARLAKFYGVKAPSESGFSRFTRPEGRRAGIFNQAGILAVSSYPNRTSPVLRGKFVLDKILGTPPPPPPPNVPSLTERADKKKPTTLRTRLETHRSQASCMSCHAMIDPIGFSLESYDAIGRYRETDDGQPIDSRGKLTTGEPVSSPEELGRVLATARREEFYKNFASTLLTYALGRGLDYYDRPTVEAIIRQAGAQGYTLPAFIDAVISSIAFQYQRNEAPTDAGSSHAAL